MSAFETNLVAIAWRLGKYFIVGQVSAAFDVEALSRDGLLHDASANSSYIDEAAIFQFGQLHKYLLPVSDPRSQAARAWLETLPDDVMFIVAHRGEFEAGIGFDD